MCFASDIIPIQQDLDEQGTLILYSFLVSILFRPSFGAQRSLRRGLIVK
jgi:hypothetical protein